MGGFAAVGVDVLSHGDYIKKMRYSFTLYRIFHVTINGPV